MTFIRTSYQGTVAKLTPDEIENLHHCVHEYQLELGIDLGTYMGASALLMHLAGAGKVYTYDLEDLVTDKNEWINYRNGDFFKGWIRDEVVDLCQRPEPKILFCDGGDKPKEIVTFGRYLQPGDILASHDYGVEWEDEDVQPFIVEHNFIELPLPYKNMLIAWIKQKEK